MKTHDYLDAELADIALFPNPADSAGLSMTDLATGLMRLAMPVMSFVPQGSSRTPRDAFPHFRFTKLREGGKHALIVVNGFLSKGDDDTSDWERAIKKKFGRATWYHLDWEAYRHPGKQLGDLFTIDGLLGKVAGKKEPDALFAWHATMLSAERAGVLLAQAILRTPGWRFTLAGHSLGARVIHFALKELAGKGRKRIENVYLLGGAVGGGQKDDPCWTKAASAVKGRIFNCYSAQDDVLRHAYQGANAMLSQPAGYAGIHLEHERIFHFDCTALVTGHLDWKPRFAEILAQLKQY